MKEPADACEISVVVPCLGHAVELRGCLEALAQQQTSVGYEVVVVDSDTDEKVRAVVREFPAVHIISGHDLRPGEARNLGISESRGRYVAFTDADCRPDPGWIEAARKSLEAGARMVGGPVLDALPFHPVAVCDNLLQMAHLPARRPRGAVRHLPGANMALRRADLDRVGGFPVSHRRSRSKRLGLGEDALLSASAARRWPGRILFEPEMAVRHLGRTSLRGYLRHHHGFGVARGLLGLRLKPTHEQLGRYAIMIPAVAFKRFGYLLGHIVRWRPSLLPFLPLLLPLLIPGLLASATGLRQGLNQRVGADR